MKKESKNHPITLKYFVALVISLITFISGLFLGFALAKKEVYLIGIDEYKIKSNLFELETTIRFLEENICDKNLLKDFGVDLDKVGEELESLQNKMFVSKEEYQYLKNFYYALEINHYMLLKKARKICNQNYTFILYFYKPVEECKLCFDQGVILSVLKKKYPERVQIYSFNIEDYNKSLLVKKMLIKYNISKNDNPPILIINGKKEGFKDMEDLEKVILNKKE